MYLWWHSPGTGRANITNVGDQDNPSSTVLCEFTRDFHAFLSPPCVAEDSRSREGFQVFLEYCGPRLQLACSSISPRTRRCGQGKVLDQLTLRTSRCVAKPAKPFWMSCGGMLVMQERRLSSAVSTQSLRLTCRMQRMLSLSKTSNILSQHPPTSMSRNRRTESMAPLPGKPCPWYATIIYAATKDRITGEGMQNEQNKPCFRSLRCPVRSR